MDRCFKIVLKHIMYHGQPINKNIVTSVMQHYLTSATLSARNVDHQFYICLCKTRVILLRHSVSIGFRIYPITKASILLQMSKASICIIMKGVIFQGYICLFPFFIRGYRRFNIASFQTPCSLLEFWSITYKHCKSWSLRSVTQKQRKMIK